MAFRQLAGSLFVDLVNELREYNNPNMPVLIAVDEYNNWEVPSAYSYNNQRVHAKQLCVPHSLNFLSLTKHGSDHWSLKNGMAIGTFVCALLPCLSLLRAVFSTVPESANKHTNFTSFIPK